MLVPPMAVLAPLGLAPPGISGVRVQGALGGSLAGGLGVLVPLWDLPGVVPQAASKQESQPSASADAMNALAALLVTATPQPAGLNPAAFRCVKGFNLMSVRSLFSRFIPYVRCCALGSSGPNPQHSGNGLVRQRIIRTAIQCAIHEGPAAEGCHSHD